MSNCFWMSTEAPQLGKGNLSKAKLWSCKWICQLPNDITKQCHISTPPRQVKGTSNVQHKHYNDGAPTTGTSMSSVDHTHQAERKTSQQANWKATERTWFMTTWRWMWEAREHCARTQHKVQFNFPQEHHMCYCVTPAHPDFRPEVILSWVSPVVIFEMGSGLKFNGWNMGYFGSNLGHFSD